MARMDWRGKSAERQIERRGRNAAEHAVSNLLPQLRSAST